MANLLTITKKPHGYYDFVVNGDTVNIVTNDRNDMTGFGNICNFKTANGANIIKQQNITFGNVTLIDGSPLATPTSMDDLIAKLASIDFYAWRDAGSGSGVDRFDDLADTFDYFGNNGQIPMVDEAQLKLVPYVLPDASYLNNFPTPLVPGKILRVKADNTGYELIDIPTFGSISMIDYGYLIEDATDFEIPQNTTAKWALINFGVWVPLTENNTDKYNTFSQTDTTVTFTNTLVENNYVIIFYQ